MTDKRLHQKNLGPYPVQPSLLFLFKFGHEVCWFKNKRGMGSFCFLKQSYGKKKTSSAEAKVVNGSRTATK